MYEDLFIRKSLFYHPGGNAGDDTVRWHIVLNHRPCSNDGSSPDRYSRQYDGSIADPDVVFNHSRLCISPRSLEHCHPNEVGSMCISGNYSRMRGQHHIISNNDVAIQHAIMAYTDIIPE